MEEILEQLIWLPYPIILQSFYRCQVVFRLSEPLKVFQEYSFHKGFIPQVPLEMATRPVLVALPWGAHLMV